METLASIQRTVYLGTFVHSISLSELEIGEKGAIGVDENGIIQFVEKNVDLEQVHEKRADWSEAKVVELKGNGFFFPGFIGTINTCSPSSARPTCHMTPAPTSQPHPPPFHP